MDTMQGQDAQPLWSILNVRDTTTYTGHAGWVNAKAVTYRLYDGSVATIEIPRSDYNAQEVQDRIHTEALKHQQVMGLSGPDVRFDVPRTTPPIDGVVR